MQRDQSASKILWISVTASLAPTLALYWQERGYEPRIIPSLEIIPEAWTEQDSHLWQGIERSSRTFLVIVSPHALGSIPNSLLQESQGLWTEIISMGGQTQKALQSRGVSATMIVPSGQSSEWLLDQPWFTPQGAHLVLLKGCQGRSVLSSFFASQGGRVSIFNTYRRQPCVWPDGLDPEMFLREIRAILVGSVAGLEAVYAMLPGSSHRLLLSKEWIVPSLRVAMILQERFEIPSASIEIKGL